MMAVVETRGLRKHFGDVQAVNGVDLKIVQGELLVILGPSGCGKTTLMRMIAGLELPTEGQVFIDEENVTELAPRDRQIAMVFQSYALYPHMSVFSNIAFPLKARHMPERAIQESVLEAASLLDISDLLDRRPRQLSGGERQRVALCRALVKEPQVLLLDEPLSNLDAKLRATARDELQRFQRRLGITTVFVTHDQIEALGMGDRIAVMSEGRVRQLGTPQQVYHDSADTFVATFLGSPGMNLLERDKVLVGFRPEQFVPEAISPTQGDIITFPFSVSRVEYLGADQLLYGNLAGNGAEGPAVSKLPSELSVPIETDKIYDFVVEKKQLRFFNKVTGLRIDPIPL